MTHTLTIIVIILIAGLLGGLTNFLRLYKMSDEGRELWIKFFKSVLMGICASGAVPLFLQIIQTNLLEIQDGASFPEKNYFVLFGFCVVAAIYSKTFLENINRKINQLEKETEEARGKVKQLEKETEEAKKMSEEVKSKVQESRSQINEVKKQQVEQQFMDDNRPAQGSVQMSRKDEYKSDAMALKEADSEYNSRENTMLAVASGTTYEDNIKYNIYYDPASRKHNSEFKYIGLYKSWAIRRVGQVLKIVYCDYDARRDVLISTNEENKSVFDSLTPDETTRIKEIIKNTEYYELETGNKFFLVDKFYETDFMLLSPIQGKQYFQLNMFKEYNPQMSAQEVAKMLTALKVY